MTATNGKGRARSVPMLYGAITAALLVAVVGLALSSPPPRTPPLAAVNPQVEEQVEVERVEQSSQFGEGQGGEGDCAPGVDCAGIGTQQDATSTSDMPTPQVTSAPGDLWPCIVGPGGARQTEDPQSPPCIGERFKGDNGGATWPGVSATEIRIGYRADKFWTDNQGEQALPAFVAHFNRHYELYGRSIVLVEVGTGNASSDPAQQRAAAEETAAKEVFATFDPGRLGAFHERMAELGVVTFTSDHLMSESRVAGMHPYVWSVYPSREQALELAGEVICKTLRGKPAQHGGDAVRDLPRRFGIIEMFGGGGLSYPADELVRRLEACGADHGVYRYDASSDDRVAILRRMQNDGITTVSCVCLVAGGGPSQMFVESDSIRYEPEWFVPGTDDTSLYITQRNFAGETTPRSQMGHVFGIGGAMRLTQSGSANFDRYGMPSEQFWFHAAKAENRSFDPKWDAQLYYRRYAQLLMLVSGIQWAGPDLNPETFGAALTGL
ncbi:MAG: hypothetical protein WEB19_03635, partial [Acidimicrobiia bacterium]